MLKIPIWSFRHKALMGPIRACMMISSIGYWIFPSYFYSPHSVVSTAYIFITIIFPLLGCDTSFISIVPFSSLYSNNQFLFGNRIFFLSLPSFQTVQQVRITWRSSYLSPFVSVFGEELEKKGRDKIGRPNR